MPLPNHTVSLQDAVDRLGEIGLKIIHEWSEGAVVVADEEVEMIRQDYWAARTGALENNDW